MHAAFIQSSFKLNMSHCTKLQLIRLYSTKQQGAKSKNHYDTLKINPHATQNEVKSAYYKLTLQYHPDKNKSEHAKQKFQDISDAYEVLGNHEQRKIYDRKMLLRRPTVSTTTQEPVSHYKDKVYSGTSKIYNFDEWTQTHYGKQMYMGRVRRQMYDRIKMTEEMHGRPKDESRFMEVAVFLFTLTMFAMFFREKPDVPVKTNKSDSEDTRN